MSSPDYLLGIHNFKGRSDDELDITRGDYIEVIEDDSEFNDTWYLGRNLATNVTGLFPRSFTTPVAALPAEIQAKKAEWDAINAAADNSDTFAPPTPTISGANTGLNGQASSAQPNGAFYGYQADANQRFAPMAQPAHASPDQPPLHKLTMNDPSSPSTDPSLMESGANSASSTEPSFDNSAVINGGSAKNYIYPQQLPQLSQVSDIDAAISAMQRSPPQEPSNGNIYQMTPQQQSSVGANGHQNPQVRSPPTAPGNVLAWSPHQVEQYFASKGLTDDAPKFVKHRITGAILLEMDRETLKEIDIVSFGPRFEIDKEIRQLRASLGMSATSPQVPTSPMTPGGYSGAAAGSMNSLVTTPVASQGGYITYSSHPGASNIPSTTGGLPNLASPIGFPGQAAHVPQMQQSQAPLPHAQPSTSHAPSQLQSQPSLPPPQPLPQPVHQPVQQQQQQYMQSSQAHMQQNANTNGTGASSYATSQPVAISQSPTHRKTGSGISKLKNGSEEEITGSISSNFSLNQSSAAVAAAQAAGRGHHRRSSSATSRYSVIANHQRSRTLDGWDETDKEAVSPVRGGHTRNLSKGSAFSSRRNSWAPQDMANGIDSAEMRKLSKSRSRNGSIDSKKLRRSSVLSLLSGSPKKVSTNTNESYKGEPANTPASPSRDSSNSSSGTGKRTSSDNSTFKSIMRPGLVKQKTSAFQEGIQNITADKAAATAVKSGWMHKRGGSGIGVWSKRFFTLHGTRLSYFTSFKDTKERGLIDITGHRVVLIKDHELLVSLAAAGMGAGRHCFKLVPPGPGYKKGVAFTAPRTHYFALDSAEEMHEWQTALMSATIERDESVPVESTCKLPTISLSKAQELMAERLKTKGEIGSLTK